MLALSVIFVASANLALAIASANKNSELYNLYNDYIIYLLHPTDEDIKDYESKDEVLEETLGQVRDMRQNIGLR